MVHSAVLHPLVVVSYRIWKAKSAFPEILKAKALKVTQAASNAPALMRPEMQKGKQGECDSTWEPQQLGQRF